MNKQTLTRVIAMILVLVMVLGIFAGTVLAAEPSEAPTEPAEASTEAPPILNAYTMLIVLAVLSMGGTIFAAVKLKKLEE